MYSFTPSPHGALGSQLLLVSEHYVAMTLFACLVFSVLSIPLFHMLTSLSAVLLRCALVFIQRRTSADFAWRPGSLFLAEGDGSGCPGGRAPAAAADAWPGVAKYQPRAEQGEEVEPVECVFCLSDVEEGEEIRELRCRHLFHRRCLDKWLVHRAAACPLCRDALVPPKAQGRCGDADDDDEDVDDPSMILVAYVRNGWWVW